MAEKIEFYLSEENVSRLFALKDRAGKSEMSGNEFAKELLEVELYSMLPSVPEIDENGEYK